MRRYITEGVEREVPRERGNRKWPGTGKMSLQVEQFIESNARKVESTVRLDLAVKGSWAPR
jgi:hypothetical protein